MHMLFFKKVLVTLRWSTKHYNLGYEVQYSLKGVSVITDLTDEFVLNILIFCSSICADLDSEKIIYPFGTRLPDTFFGNRAYLFETY